MKMRIVMIIALLIFQSIDDSCSACSEQAVSTNENDDSCQTYIFCFRLSDGVFIEKVYRCPNGTLFDPSKNNCDEKFECVDTPLSLTPITETPKNEYECKEGGRFPDEDDVTCIHYFFCYYLPSGKYLVRNYICPLGSRFNPQLQTCSPTYQCNVLPAKTTTMRNSPTTTIQKTFNCTKQGRFPVEEDVTCRSYFTCLYLPDGGFTEEVYLCPSILKFDPQTESCNANYQCSSTPLTSTTQSNIFRCPSTGRFPDKTDTTCRAYFYCIVFPDGQLGFQTFNCPKDQEFDPEVKLCSSTYRCYAYSSTHITTDGTNLICQSSGQFPNFSDETCESYFVCSASPTGELEATKKSCEFRELFDPNLKECSSTYTCHGESGSTSSGIPSSQKFSPSEPEASDTADTFSEDPRISNSTEKSELESSTQEYSSNEITDFEIDVCESVGRFAIIEDETCKSYYLCIVGPNQNLISLRYSCVLGEFFDPLLQKCSSNYTCTSNSTPKGSIL